MSVSLLLQKLKERLLKNPPGIISFYRQDINAGDLQTVPDNDSIFDGASNASAGKSLEST